MSVSVSSTNWLVGEVRFLSFEVPDDWNVRPVPHRVYVQDFWEDEDGRRWAVDGRTTLEAIQGEGETTMGIYIRAKGYDENLDMEKWSSEAVKGGNKECLRSGLLNGAHGKAYVLFKKSKKKYLIFGERFREFILKMALKCNETNRIIFIEVRSLPNQELDEDFVRTFLTSIECH